MVEHLEKDNFLWRERRVDNYELNWRLTLATQLMGESQVGGSIIALMLDLCSDAFWNAWSPMEEALGVEQIKIGAREVDFNLKKETMGKVAIFCKDIKEKYPVLVLYDTGWQKAAKTFDSLSGQ